MTGGWIPALRIARREAWKAKGRSALVLAMIGLPVACMAFLAAGYDMFTLTRQEEIDRRLGSADALVMWESSGPLEQSVDGFSYGGQGGGDDKPGGEADLRTLLPQGTRLVRVDTFEVRLRTAAGVGTVTARLGEPGDPLFRGMVRVLQGTAPTQGDQVALSPQAAERYHTKVGDTIRTIKPDSAFTVTAIVEYPDDLYPLFIFPNAAANALPLNEHGGWWLADTPQRVDWAQVQKLNTHGVKVASREVMLDPPPTADASRSRPNENELAVGSVVVGLAMIEIVLLAGPAFAVGARRRARDLALVATAGGEPKHLRRIVFADGVVLGLTGAIVGIALGVAVAFASVPLLEVYGAGHRIGAYRMFPLGQLGIAGLAVITGVLAALVPAFTAARQDVVRTLSDRRGIVRSRKRWIAVGLSATAVGAAIATAGALVASEETILAGIVLTELGLVLLTPSLIGLVARAGRWLPLAPRLALRDTARNRASAAPAISAVMAAMAGAVTAGIVISAGQQQQAAMYRPIMPVGHVSVMAVSEAGHDWQHIGAAFNQSLPAGADVHELRSVDGAAEIPTENECPAMHLRGEPTEAERKAILADPRCASMRGYSGVLQSTVVDDGAALGAITDADPAALAAARQALARGEIVVTSPLYLRDGKVMFSGDIFPGYLLSARNPAAWVIVPESVARKENLSPRIVGLIASTKEMKQDNEERLTEAVHSIDQDLWINVERGARPRQDPITLILALSAAGIAIAAAGIATGLAAADSKRDLGTLAAIGAAPRVRRILSLSQAGIISGLGALLGTLSGVGAAGVLILALNQISEFNLFGPPPMELAVPWDAIAVIMAVPLVAMAGAGLLAKSRLPIERRL